jgi:hypothetical protein
MHVCRCPLTFGLNPNKTSLVSRIQLTDRQARTENYDSPTSESSTITLSIALPSFLRRLWSFVGSEGLLQVKGYARYQTRETLTMLQRRTSFVQCPTTTADAHRHALLFS